ACTCRWSAHRPSPCSRCRCPPPGGLAGWDSGVRCGASGTTWCNHRRPWSCRTATGLPPGRGGGNPHPSHRSGRTRLRARVTMRIGGRRNLDNAGRPIVHLNVPGEVAGRVEEGLNDLAGGLVAVSPDHIERASQTELVAVRRESVQDAVGEEKDKVAWRQRD